MGWGGDWSQIPEVTVASLWGCTSGCRRSGQHAFCFIGYN